MTKHVFDELISAFKGGANELGSRTNETVTQLADSVGRILEEAGAEGVKIKKTLVRNWTTLERPRRNRNVGLLFGALGVSIAAAYFLRRVAATSSTSAG